jgi:hypothetical protein
MSTPYTMSKIFQYGNGKVGFVILIALLIFLSSVSEATDPLRIDDDFLKKYLTQLKNPRLMKIEDATLEYERNWFLDSDSGCSFVIEGDFNKDGNSEFAVVGKYDGPYPNNFIFVAVLSKRRSKVVVEFLYKHEVPYDRAFLCKEEGKRLYVKNANSRFDVIIISFAYSTDYVTAIAWNGKKYFIPEEWWYLGEEESKKPVQPPL